MLHTGCRLSRGLPEVQQNALGRTVSVADTVRANGSSPGAAADRQNPTPRRPRRMSATGNSKRQLSYEEAYRRECGPDPDEDAARARNSRHIYEGAVPT